MLHQRLFLILAIVGLLLTGCGNNSNINEISGQQGGNNVVLRDVRLQFLLAQSTQQPLPTNVTDIRLTGFAQDDVVTFGPQEFVKAPLIDIKVNEKTIRIFGELLEQDGSVFGTFTQPLTLNSDQLVTISIGSFSPVVRNNILRGRYFGVASVYDICFDDSLERETNIKADLEFDGNGQISSGPVCVVQHDGTTNGSHQGGTYTASTNGAVTANVQTAFGLVKVSQEGFLDTTNITTTSQFGTSVVTMDDGKTAGPGYLIRRGENLTVADFNGRYAFNGCYSTLGDTRTCYYGFMDFDGNGNATCQYFDRTLGVRYSTTPVFSGTGTYTVGTNGDFSCSYTFPQFTYTCSGAYSSTNQCLYTSSIVDTGSGDTISSGIGYCTSIEVDDQDNEIAGDYSFVSCELAFDVGCDDDTDDETRVREGDVNIDSTGKVTGTAKNLENGEEEVIDGQLLFVGNNRRGSSLEGSITVGGERFQIDAGGCEYSEHNGNIYCNSSVFTNTTSTFSCQLTRIDLFGPSFVNDDDDPNDQPAPSLPQFFVDYQSTYNSGDRNALEQFYIDNFIYNGNDFFVVNRFDAPVNQINSINLISSSSLNTSAPAQFECIVSTTTNIGTPGPPIVDQNENAQQRFVVVENPGGTPPFKIAIQQTLEQTATGTIVPDAVTTALSVPSAPTINSLTVRRNGTLLNEGDVITAGDNLQFDMNVSGFNPTDGFIGFFFANQLVNASDIGGGDFRGTIVVPPTIPGDQFFLCIASCQNTNFNTNDHRSFAVNSRSAEVRTGR